MGSICVLVHGSSWRMDISSHPQKRSGKVRDTQMKNLRIAVGQISSESNHFVPGTCNVDFFRTTGYLHEGEEVFHLADTDTEAGGMLRAASRAEIVPLLATRGNSLTVLSDVCWRRLKQGVLRRLEKAGRVDGVVMSHHGSMAVESVDDPEGELAAEIRAIIGPTTPFAMTLDLHGNVTRRMVDATDIICGYEIYPHQDARRTGERATRLLRRTIRGEIRPVMAHGQLPMILTGFCGSTFGKGRFAQLMRAAKELEGVAPHPSNPPPLARVRQPTREISEFSPCGLRKCLSPRECSPQTSL
jgi:microcystin degradation protein MlrC